MANWFVMRNFQLFHENLRIRSFSHLVLKNIPFDAKFRNDLGMFHAEGDGEDSSSWVGANEFHKIIVAESYSFHKELLAIPNTGVTD